MFFFGRSPFKKIEEEIHYMATTLAQLDDAITALTTAQQKLVADVKALVDKINAGQDVTAEMANVNTSVSALQSADASAQAVLAPPAPAPTPSPAPAPPVV